MKKQIRVLSFLLLALSGIHAHGEEITGELTTELAGITLDYEYVSGRKYTVTYHENTLEYLRRDVPGRDWERGVAYIARKINDDLYLLNWHRPDRVEYVTILIDLENRILHTSALLEGTERHFDQANIVSISTP